MWNTGPIEFLHSYLLPATSATSYQLPSYQLPVTCHQFPVTSILDPPSFVSYDGNRRKTLIRIPYTVRHITKCLCFRLKNKHKFSVATKFFRNEIDLVGYFRGRDLYETDNAPSRNIMTLRSYIERIWWIRRCDNLGHSLHFKFSLRFVPSLPFKPAICNLQPAFYTNRFEYA